MSEENFKLPETHLDHYNFINELCRENTEASWVQAANYYRDMVEMKGSISNIDKAKTFLNIAWKGLLESEAYLEAATMNWGYMKFDARPELVQDVFKFIPEHNQMAILGGSSTSKSYSTIAWLYLDYQRDPDYTQVKFVTISGDKLRGILFGPLFDLHESSVMNVVGKAGTLTLGHKPDNVNIGFQGILIPQDQQGTGKLKGVKYYRRTPPHPKFGYRTRTRIFVDEFQDTSSGLIQDLDSPLSQKTGPDPMKVIISGNPTSESLTGSFGTVTEPEQGWINFNIEEDHFWKSKKGWQVLRLDGARSENVIYRKDVFYGMQTYEYFDAKAKEGLTASYYTFARGIFPLSGASNNLISIPMFEGSLGMGIFHEGSTNAASVDVALRGDAVIFSIGRFGMATGKRNRSGQETMFTTSKSDQGGRAQFLLQVDNQIEIKDFGGDVVNLSKRIIDLCKEYNIKPEHLAIDATGLGEGVYSYISNYFGACLAVRWGEKATEKKILVEDKQTAEQEYMNISSELWYAFQKWMSVGAVLINPGMDLDELRHQTTTRNASNKGNKVKKLVESKDEWKLRNQGKSPDHADSAIMLVHLVRHRSPLLPAMEKSLEILKQKKPFNPPNTDYIDSLRFNGLEHDRKKEKPFNINDLRKPFVINEIR